MQGQTSGFRKRSEPRDRKGARPERRPARDEGASTEEEAFYAAQEEAFADLRVRNQARPRRKP